MLTPSFVVTAYYLLKYGAKVSPRAEVDLSKYLQFGKGCTISSYTKIKAIDGPVTFGKAQAPRASQLAIMCGLVQGVPSQMAQ